MRKLKADEIECRVAQVSENGCSLLLYKTARVDRAILDETFGDLWQNDFKVIDGKMYGGIGVFNKELNQWLWRWDCGVESNTEAEKGQASDAFKRAGFKWGIGVELYTAPFIFLPDTSEKDEYNSKIKGKPVYRLKNKYLKYKVDEIGYAENGDINNLVISDSNCKKVYTMAKKYIRKKTTENDDTNIYIALANIDEIDALKQYYEINKGNVNDQKQFHEMVTQRLHAIKESAA